MIKPRKRSLLRIYAGKKWYRLRRYREWYFGGKSYASPKRDHPILPHMAYEHGTLLLRKLRDVDMWLQYNKITNLSLAVRKLNGIMIKPGETFSYWRLIGDTTRRKGYVDGMILFYGKVKTGTGGGLCQLSNLIYWMTLHTPLTVTERYRHSYDVFPDASRSQPFGSGATCAYNYLDLQIKNETDQPYQLVLSLTETHLVGEWRTSAPPVQTYEVYEKEHWITQEYWGGYIRHNKLYRKVFNREREWIDEEFITENHAIMMYEPMLDSGNISEES